jgi:hypothetical protein
LIKVNGAKCYIKNFHFQTASLTSAGSSASKKKQAEKEQSDSLLAKRPPDANGKTAEGTMAIETFFSTSSPAQPIDDGNNLDALVDNVAEATVKALGSRSGALRSLNSSLRTILAVDKKCVTLLENVDKISKEVDQIKNSLYINKAMQMHVDFSILTKLPFTNDADMELILTQTRYRVPIMAKLMLEARDHALKPRRRASTPEVGMCTSVMSKLVTPAYVCAHFVPSTK